MGNKPPYLLVPERNEIVYLCFGENTVVAGEGADGTTTQIRASPPRKIRRTPPGSPPRTLPRPIQSVSTDLVTTTNVTGALAY